MRAYKKKKNLRHLIKKAFYDATSLRTIFVAQKTKSSSFMYIEKHKKNCVKKTEKKFARTICVKKPLHFNLPLKLENSATAI